MKKINTIELTEKLNKFRMAHPNKSFTREELKESLLGLGFNSQTEGAIVPKFFPYEKIGTNRIYNMPKEPIHKSAIEAVYESFRRTRNKSRNQKKEEIHSQNSEEAALALLASKGYQIRKCVGFDLERFQKEQPILYRKYLKYETV
jgi:hypothetical protein